RPTSCRKKGRWSCSPPTCTTRGSSTAASATASSRRSMPECGRRRRETVSCHRTLVGRRDRFVRHFKGGEGTMRLLGLLLLEDLPKPLQQWLQTLPAHTGNGEDLFLRQVAAELRQRLVVDRQVHLVGGDDLALVGQGGAERFQLAADGAVVLGGVGAVHGEQVEQVNDHLRALDVAEEVVAEAGAVPGAFD